MVKYTRVKYLRCSFNTLRGKINKVEVKISQKPRSYLSLDIEKILLPWKQLNLYISQRSTKKKPNLIKVVCLFTQKHNFMHRNENFLTFLGHFFWSLIISLAFKTLVLHSYGLLLLLQKGPINYGFAPKIFIAYFVPSIYL